MEKIKKCIWGLEPKDRHCEFCTAYCELRPKEESVTSDTVYIPRTIKATMEKCYKDGSYSIYSNVKIGNSYLGGYGRDEKDAKKDFQTSIGEAVLENIKIEYDGQG